MNRKLKTVFALVVSLSFAALALGALGICATGALADNPCEPCACSGDATCEGCRCSYKETDCTNPGLCLPVKVPFLQSMHNYCFAGVKTGDCLTVCLTCYIAKKGAAIYIGGPCTEKIGNLPQDCNVFADGCIPGGP